MKLRKRIMVDLESTGVEFAKDDILQIAMLEVNFNGQYWFPGHSLNLVLYSDRKPTNEFAREHMTALYAQSNVAPKLDVAEVRRRILSFLSQCGVQGPRQVFFMGQNASSFDVPFMVAKGFLEAPHYVTEYGKDRMVGDFHYRVYEISGALEVTEDVTGMPRSTLHEMSERDHFFEIPVPQKEHDGLYDCYSQTRTLNSLIATLRNFR